jgi:hypothetical protein
MTQRFGQESVAEPTRTCRIQYMMNKILFKHSKRHTDWTHGEVLIVPFICGDAKGMHLHEPRYNRSGAENAMAASIMERVQAALTKAGYTLVNFSFSSWTLTVKPINPVK